MNHHHWPKYSLHKSLHWNNFPHWMCKKCSILGTLTFN
jgi:hypothetical protein